MPGLIKSPPASFVDPVTELLHGIPVTDPYRWLEDQDSARTRAWLKAQQRHTRSYFNNIPWRGRARRRIRCFLDVETYDSLQRVGTTYFFRKRVPNQAQPSIYMRPAESDRDQLLIDPRERETGPYTAVKPLLVSPDERLLLYEVKQGGERTGSFELMEIATRRRLPDRLARGYLRGFAFAPDSKTFFYVHEAVDAKRPFRRAAYEHVLGTPFTNDREIFFAGEGQKVRLVLISDNTRLGLLVYHFKDKTLTDVHLKSFDSDSAPKQIFAGLPYTFSLRLLDGKILALTDRDAPNRRIVEIQPQEHDRFDWVDIVPETNMMIKHWLAAGKFIFVCYSQPTSQRIVIFDLAGNKLSELPAREGETVTMLGASAEGGELFLNLQSFTEPPRIFRFNMHKNSKALWAQRSSPIDSAHYTHSRQSYTSKDGTSIPICLVGRRDLFERRENPTILTSYGGFGVMVTPQFSVLVAFMMERGCLFALPAIRGGSEFAAPWHDAARRQNRQTAYDDFLSAAEWLIESGRTHRRKLAIFGGSNSGLLVAAAMTQRPELFRAVLCMVPLLDMLRYHLFDNAHVWKEEFGTAEDAADFSALFKYSPYHHVRNGDSYPATMFVSGDADGNCNPLHARKMTARLQAANASEHPILLDYRKFRGHSPVLPLGERIEALTDRVVFLCDQLELS